jgi:hypothetical protein
VGLAWQLVKAILRAEVALNRGGNILKEGISRVFDNTPVLFFKPIAIEEVLDQDVHKQAPKPRELGLVVGKDNFFCFGYPFEKGKLVMGFASQISVDSLKRSLC